MTETTPTKKVWVQLCFEEEPQGNLVLVSFDTEKVTFVDDLNNVAKADKFKNSLLHADTNMLVVYAPGNNDALRNDVLLKDIEETTFDKPLVLLVQQQRTASAALGGELHINGFCCYGSCSGASFPPRLC